MGDGSRLGIGGGWVGRIFQFSFISTVVTSVVFVNFSNVIITVTVVAIITFIIQIMTIP